MFHAPLKKGNLGQGMNSVCTVKPHQHYRVLYLPSYFISTTLWLACVFAQTAMSRTPPVPQADAISIEGMVHDATGQPVAGASVVLQEKAQDASLETKTDVGGKFGFSLRKDGDYTVTVEKSGFVKCVTDSLTLSAGQRRHLDLLLQTATTARSAAAGTMDFDDRPNFAVAGVTDWSGAGGHGSDTTLRTSEAFARETLALKSNESKDASHTTSATTAAPEVIEAERKLHAAAAAAPNDFEANHQLGEFYLHSGRSRDAIAPLKAAYQVNPENVANAYSLALAYRSNGDLVLARDLAAKTIASAEDKVRRDLMTGSISYRMAHPPGSGGEWVPLANFHRLMGDLDERLGDPLRAVREYERAATLDPSEQNYFEWGSELLLHRAVAPAVAVFKKGSLAHPDSSRLLVGLGAALFSAGSYDDASRELCHASDLSPDDSTPYLFLGKMDVSSPTLFPCIEGKLARFLKNQPANAWANYYFAMSLVKKDREANNSVDIQQAQALLEKSVSLDSKFGEAYLQLGNLYAAQGASDKAIAAYTKAIEATPSLSEPHYRLSLLYKRSGQKAKADQEIQFYKQVDKTEADAAERQRHEIQQFLIILKEQPAASVPH